MARKHLGKDKINEFFNILDGKYSGDIKFSREAKLDGRSWGVIIENVKK